MSRGIDYSKWDNLKCDDSDEEDNRRTPLQVTKLARPSQVTWNDDGSFDIAPTNASSNSDEIRTSSNKTDTVDASANTSSVSVPKTSAAMSSSKTNNSIPAANQVKTPTTFSTSDEWTKHGGVVTLPESIGAAAGGSTLYWSQDRTSVTIRWQVPTAVITAPPAPKLSFQVQLQGGVPFRERNSAVLFPVHNTNIDPISQQPHPKLLVSLSSVVLWQANLPYPIHYDEDDDDDDDDATKIEKQHYVDWNVEGGNETNEKYLRVTWQKAVPMQGMTIWWKRPLLDVPEVDVIPGRSSATQQEQGSSSSFQDTWNQAHEQFRAKLAQEKQHQQQREQQQGDEEGT